MTHPARFAAQASSIVSLAALLASCGPRPAPSPDAAAEAREAQAVAPEAVPVGPVPLEPGSHEADLRVSAERSGGAPTPEAQRSTPAPSPNRVSSGASSASSGVWREDGRPAWWVDRAGWRDGRYTLSAEALGDDVLSARRAAIAAARTEAARALGQGMRDERVESATVRRLTTDAPGRERYVGYVLMSALRAAE